MASDDDKVGSPPAHAVVRSVPRRSLSRLYDIASERTLRDDIHVFPSVSGFNLATNRQLMTKAKIEKLTKFQKQIVLLLDALTFVNPLNLGPHDSHGKGHRLCWFVPGPGRQPPLPKTPLIRHAAPTHAPEELPAPAAIPGIRYGSHPPGTFHIGSPAERSRKGREGSKSVAPSDTRVAKCLVR